MYIHDWDEKLVYNPVRKLVNFAKSELASLPVSSASYMVNFNIVQEVHTIDGINFRHPTPRNPLDITSQLFPSVSPKV